MQKALSILGYPSPYHFSNQYDNVQDSDLWMEMINAKFEGIGTYSNEDFDRALGHCGACTDIPSILFAPELIEYYSDAKVVLVERDIDAWYESWSTFLDSAMNPTFPALAQLDPNFFGRIARSGMAGTSICCGHGVTKEAAKARSKEAYRRHYAHIRSVTPKERLLEFKLADGWEPLCHFLGKPVPDVPFPRENDSASNAQGFRELVALSLKKMQEGMK